MQEKRACKNCIGEPYLYQSLRQEWGTVTECSYCHERRKTLPVSRIAEKVREGLETEYAPYEREPSAVARARCHMPGDNLQHLLAYLYPSGNLLWEDLSGFIDEGHPRTWYRRDQQYFGDHKNPSVEWNRFCHMVQYETRYVFFRQDGDSGDQERTDILDFLGDAVTELDLIKSIPEGCRFYRGRAHARHQRYSLEDLTAPPPRAAKVNRMSAEGISLFYGASDARTALAEIYNYKYEYATVVQFCNAEPLNLLDLSNDRISLPSLFDEKNRYKRKYANFFREFVHTITTPIDSLPGIEYVPTQILTEYFRYVYTYGCFLNGLIYTSSKNPKGKCYVLFYNHDQCVKGQDQKLVMDEQSLANYRLQYRRIR